MQIRKKIQLGIITTALGLSANVTCAEVVVIVSAKSPVNALNSDQVAKIFLGNAGSFPLGMEAVPLDLPEASAARQEFYAKVVRKSPAMLKSHWSKLLFTGRGYPPKEVSSDEAVKRKVAENPKFIGYVDRSAVDASVKIVLSSE